MAGLNSLTAAQWDQALAEGYTAAAKRAGLPVIDLGNSSQFAAFFYAVRNTLMQQQTQTAYAVLLSRFATCYGADADSFGASFGFLRLLATFAQGRVVCSTGSAPAAPVPVPVGSRFGTRTGAQGAVTYVVIADPTNPAFSLASGSQGAYIIPISTNPGPASVSVTVACEISGAVGNAQPGQITQILAGAIVPAGIASVTNPAAFTSAIDVESDPAYKARFQARFAGGQNSGSNLSLLATALSVQPGLTVSVADNTFQDGTPRDGWVAVVVNELGATTPPTGQLTSAVTAAIDAVRTAGIRRTVNGINPTVTFVNFSAHLVFRANADVLTETSNATAAVTAYLNGIGLDPKGAPTTISLAQLYRAITVSTPDPTGSGYVYNPDILDVAGLTLNGQAGELTAPFATQFAAGQITFV